MKGQLPKFSVEAVLQVLGSGRSTGAFVVEHTDGSVFVGYLKEGQLTHAEFGDAVGMDALSKLLRDQKGEFQFRAGYASNQRSLQGSLEMVLMGAFMESSRPVRRPVRDNVPLGQVKFKMKGGLGLGSMMMDDTAGPNAAVIAPPPPLVLNIQPVLWDLQRDPRCSLTARVGLKQLRAWEKTASRGITQIEVRTNFAKQGMILGVAPAPDLEDTVAIEPNLAESLDVPEQALVWVKPV